MTNTSTIKQHAAGRWPEILAALGGVRAELLDGKNHPCPKCEGTDRFRMIDQDAGAVLCNQCFREKNGDGIAALMWFNGWTFTETINRLNDYLSNGKNGKTNVKPQIVATYDYRDETGNLLFQVVRYEPGESKPKDFRQRKPKDGGGWEWKIGDVRRVLYRLPQLLAADPAEIVYIVEGEKDVERLVKRDRVATTNAGGAGKWRLEYNEHLRGRRVAILPDKDEVGRKHAQDVAKSLYGIAATIKVVELPGKGKDAWDWFQWGGMTEELLNLVEAAPLWTPETAPSTTASTIEAKPVLSWKPFPISALPEPIKTYVKRASAAIGVDPSYVATAILAALAGTIGNSRLILLKRGWVEPAVLWGVVVGDSGTQKSPAIDIATKHIRQRQATAIETYRQAAEQYERDVEQYKADLDRWRHGGKKKGEPAPQEVVKPICERFACSDVTIEGLAVLLADAWRGLLLIRDELAGWVSSFDQYKGGRGSDTAHWLTIHGARDLLVDRKTSDRKMIFVPRAAVSICGGIQPGTLSRVLGTQHIENGLAARLLLAMPPRQPKQWSEAEIDAALDQCIGMLFDELFRMAPQIDANGQPEPVVLGLSAAGKNAWIEFYNEHAERQADATGEQAAALSKIEGAAARIALVLHCVRQAAGGRGVTDQIDDQDVGSGVVIARWYADEAERVYSVLRETDDDRLQRQITDLVRRKGGAITARQLRQSMRQFRDSTEAAELALETLVAAGLGSWTTAGPADGGGRPTQTFRLSTPSTVYETPQSTEKPEGFVDTDEASGVVGWSEFDQFGESAEKPLVYETPQEHEENDSFVDVDNVDGAETEWEEITL